MHKLVIFVGLASSATLVHAQQAAPSSPSTPPAASVTAQQAGPAAAEPQTPSAGEKATSTSLAALAQGKPEEKSPVKVEAKAGSGYTISVGDDFSLNFANRVQFAWRFDDNDTSADVNNFRIPRARTKLKGHLFDKDTTYQLQLDWVSSKMLKDAWLRRVFWKSEEAEHKLSARVGQQKPMFGKEFTASTENLEHTDRSLASRTFAGSRVVGVFLEGSHLAGDLVHWDVGIADSDAAGASSALESGDGAANVDNELNYYFGLRFDPFGDLLDEGFKYADLAHSQEIKGTIGAGLEVGNHRTAATAPDVETTSINLNTAWQYQGFQISGEVFVRTDDTSGAGGAESDHTGWAAGLSYVTAKPETGSTQWGGAVRYSMVENDDPAVLLTKVVGLGAAAGDVSELQGTITAYHHEHKLKTQFGYTLQEVDPNAANSSTNHIFEILFQWVF